MIVMETAIAMRKKSNMTQTVTLRVPLPQIREINSILSAGQEDDQYGPDEVIFYKTAKFDDGVEADIKVCNGDPPFIDAVLFYDGHEVCILDSAFEEIEGEYYFKYDKNEYIVIVEEE